MIFSRTELLVGAEGMEILSSSRVAIYGIGGVGGHAAEAVVRAGVGGLLLVDHDIVDPSNINRQIIALDCTVGLRKVDVARERFLHINGRADIAAVPEFIGAGNADRLVPEDLDFAIDAIDSLDSKVELIAELLRKGIPFVSSMGAAVRMDPLGVRITDISKTRYCPLARRIRKGLRQRGIETGVTCIYSEEPVIVPPSRKGTERPLAGPLGSISYMPAIFGLTAAARAIQSLLEEKESVS